MIRYIGVGMTMVVVLLMCLPNGLTEESCAAKHLRGASGEGTEIVLAPTGDVVVHRAAFSEQELAAVQVLIDVWVEHNPELPLGVVSDDTSGAFHQDGVVFLPFAPMTQWLFEKLAALCRKANEEQGWGYELQSSFHAGSYDYIQIATYLPGAFYGAHVDVKWTNGVIKPGMGKRHVAVVMLFNDPKTDYEGGRLHYYVANENAPGPTFAPEEKATVITWRAETVFHGVTEVTKGMRRVLVWWMRQPDTDDDTAHSHDEL